MATVLTIETPTLGDRSYLVHDGQVAFVVDPQRDIDRVLDVAEQAGVRITHVLETHVHNDYVTGGLALARATGARYHLNAADRVGFAHDPVRPGDLVEVSATLRIRVIATPGHTFTHLSYALEEPMLGGTELDGAPQAVAVFSGGSLLFGATGRPDLLGAAHTHELVHHQYASAQRLARLPDAVRVLPTHGFGSFCSTGSTSGAAASTIGQEKRDNPVLTLAQDAWVTATLDRLDEYPAYYAQMARLNDAGPPAPDLSPPAPVDNATISERLQAGEWVVDLRHRAVFAAGHLPGSTNIGLDGEFATHLGWLIAWGAPITLLADSPEQVAAARRELVRIGVDRLAGARHGRPADWTDAPLGRFPRADFADLAQVRHHRRVAVLDVRRRSEWARAHIADAVHIPLHDVLRRLDEVPEGEVWVHCGGGYRAAIAASLLAARGVKVVAVDDGFAAHAAASGLPVVTRSPSWPTDPEPNDPDRRLTDVPIRDLHNLRQDHVGRLRPPRR